MRFFFNVVRLCTVAAREIRITPELMVSLICALSSRFLRFLSKHRVLDMGTATVLYVSSSAF
jgi:hypothetical protein